MGKIKEVHVSEARLAKILEISPRYVREMFINYKISTGLYNLIPSIDHYIRETDINKIKAETARFKLEVLKKDYHHVDDITMFVTDLVAKIKSKTLAIPSKGARLISGETDIVQIESILKSLVDDILLELTTYDDLESLKESMDGQEN